jgi:DNA invertase Pin-like site-specific DNA recombinase
MIQERVRAGLARAVAEETKLGRPKLDAATEAAIRKALAKGDTGIRKIAKLHGVGNGTVARIKQAMAA